MIFPAAILATVALPIVVLVETYVLKIRLPNYSQQALTAATRANLVSTFVGIPLAWLAMLALSLLLGGGGANFDTTWEKVLSVTRDAAWFYPYEDWQVPAAQLVLLVPFFFVSYWIETGIVAKILKLDWNEVRTSCFLANLLSYLMQGIVVVGIFFADTMGFFASVSNEEMDRFRSSFSKEITFINEIAGEFANHVWEIPNSSGVYKVDEEWFQAKIDAVDCSTFLYFSLHNSVFSPGFKTSFDTTARCHRRNTISVEDGRPTDFGLIDTAIYRAPRDATDAEKAIDQQTVYTLLIYSPSLGQRAVLVITAIFKK